MTVKPDLPIVPSASRGAWEEWLEERRGTSDGVWLKIAKKGSGIESIAFAEALDVDLCYCWIDSQADKLDGDYWLQRFTPRKARSRWSRVNREKVARLIKSGEMKPAGLLEVERAGGTVPDDLRVALERDEGAREFFEKLDKTNRYAILYRIQAAKRPGTRARRIAGYVAMLAEGKKLYPREAGSTQGR